MSKGSSEEIPSLEDFKVGDGPLSEEQKAHITSALVDECNTLSFEKITEFIDAGLKLNTDKEYGKEVGNILLNRAGRYADVEFFEKLVTAEVDGILETTDMFQRNVLHIAAQKSPETLAAFANCLDPNIAAELLTQRNYKGEDPLLQSFKANEENLDGLNTLKDFVVGLLGQEKLSGHNKPYLDSFLGAICEKLVVEKPALEESRRTEVPSESKEAASSVLVGGEGGAAAPEAPKVGTPDRKERVARMHRAAITSAAEVALTESPAKAPSVPEELDVSKIVGSMKTSLTAPKARDGNPDRVSFKPARVIGGANGPGTMGRG